jgi:polyhydroxybutyrate depolymerase
MRLARCVAWISCVILVALGVAANATAREERWILHDGIERSYLIETPDLVESSRPPLVILLHGGTQSASRVWRQTILPELARTHGFILAAPNAVDAHWNDHRTVLFGTNSPSDADDVGFIATLIDDIVANDGADPSRVYVTGASNGGFMSFRVACELTERVAAVGAVIASMPIGPDTYCRPSVPIPIIMIAGTIDPYIPFDGGVVTVRGRNSEPTLAVPDVARFWARNNGCSLTPTVEDLFDRTSRDRSTVQQWAFDACSSNAPVLLYVVNGGGHMWPTAGALPTGARLAATVLGPVNRDIDASMALWNFFSRFSR